MGKESEFTRPVSLVVAGTLGKDVLKTGSHKVSQKEQETTWPSAQALALGNNSR